LGESAALAILQLVFGLFFAPGAWHRRRIAAAAGAAGLLIATHPLSVLTTGVAGALWQGVETWREGCGAETRRRLAMRAAAAVLGLAMAGFYVVPVAARLGSVSIDEGAVRSRDAGEIRLARQGLRLTQPFRRLPWNGLLRSEPRGAPRDADGQEVPHYLGWGLFACALLAGARGAGKTARGAGAAEAPELTVAIVAFGALALTFHPSAIVLARLPLLPSLQFAWRFLGPASFAAALAAGFVARRLILARRRLVLAALPVLLIADAFPYTGAPDWTPAYDGFVHFYRDDSDCGRWGCWKTEAIDGPLPFRVYGTFLPPTRFGEEVSHVKPGFGEYLNTRALHRVLRAANRADWGELGVGMTGDASRGVRVLDADPYAQWLGASSERPLPLEFRRCSGTIEVDLPGGTGTLVVLEQVLPGWEATVDGEPVAIETTRDGLIRIPVPRAGTKACLRYRFSGADVTAGRASSLAALVLVVVLAFGGRRRPAARISSDDA